MDKKLFWAGYVAGLLLTVAIGYYGYHKLTSVPKIDLAKIELQSLSGIPLNLSYHNEKPLVVNFWATWCGPCREEFPAFNKAYAKYGDRVNFVMISDEDPEKITTFKSLGMYPFMFVRSVKSLDNYGINSIPLTYFYNAKGEQVGQKSGAITQSELENEIQKILTETH